MSKGLEIINLYEDSNYLNTFHPNFMKDLQIVKKDLQRLESIDNAKPSEALECLDRIDNTLCLNNIKGKLEFCIDTEEHTDCDSVIGMTEDLESIKQALHRLETTDKVLGILKPYLRLVDNYLQVKVDVLFNCWLVVKEITDEEELEVLKKILGKRKYKLRML